MVKRIATSIVHAPFTTQTLGLTALVLATLFWLSIQQDGFVHLWLTANQQARLAFEDKNYKLAAERFDDPAWQGVAFYRNGAYTEAADAFGRIGSTEAFFNRGNAFMKRFEFAKAITAYEQAVAEAPGWQAAAENLALARHTLDYVEEAREQSSTGELEADDVVYDNERERGQEITVDRESALEAASAEKWMRSVDTETADFLRSRFQLEAARRGEL
jgi:Ca-activated chloride channel family protein